MSTSQPLDVSTDTLQLWRQERLWPVIYNILAVTMIAGILWLNVLDVRNDPAIEDDVDRPITYHLIGDTDVAGGRILRFRQVRGRHATGRSMSTRTLSRRTAETKQCD